MSKEFEAGDQVSWNYAGNTVKGKVIKVHTKDFTFKGKQRRCSEEDPQYEVESDETGETAVHTPDALTKK